jgi:hypothetical protein
MSRVTGRERLARLRASLAAAGAGWAAAMAPTLPMALYKVWREGVSTNSLGGWRPLLWSLGAGTGIWVAWSLAIVFGAWLLGALPAIALVREQWLLRHKGLAVLLSAALAELVVLVKFQFWRWFAPDYYVDAWLLTLYSLLLVVFAASAAGRYLRSIGRMRLGR